MSTVIACEKCRWSQTPDSNLESVLTASAHYERHLVNEHGMERAVAAERARAYLTAQIPSARSARPPSNRPR